ncbi:MAG: hypothetical protein ACK5C5_03835 [Bacteroidota bacterium]|jgi:hypothetical protein
MAYLSTHWFTEKHIDFEYKKYQLLGYLQQVEEQFRVTRIYPCLSDLINHYRNAVSIRDSKRFLSEAFTEQLKGADFTSMKLVYEQVVADDEVMSEVEQIVAYSIPMFEKYIREGRTIYEFIESRMNLTPVGIVPLQTGEGYLLLRPSSVSGTNVYQYQITLFEGPQERYRGVHTHYLCSYQPSPASTFENIKSDLIRQRADFPNPAIYAVEAELELPVDEALLPVAKRTLVRYISAGRGAC